MLVSGRPFQKHVGVPTSGTQTYVKNYNFQFPECYAVPLLYIFPVLSIFHTCSSLYSLVISLACSFQLSSTFSLTSPSSPAVFIRWRKCCFLRDCIHPFYAGKPLISIFSARRRASFCSIVPDTGMFDCLQRLYHSHNVSSTSEYFAGRTLLMTRLHACLILGQNLLLGTQKFLGLCAPCAEFVCIFTITWVWIIFA